VYLQRELGTQSLPRSGGYSKDKTEIIIEWKMKKENDTGLSGWDFMMIRRVRGLFMFFFA
jgi:hypothetical protein